MNLNNKNLLIICGTVCLVIFGFLYYDYSNRNAVVFNENMLPFASEPTTDATSQIIETTEAVPTYVTVYICGEVQNAGLYTLETGSRVGDVLDLAGGPTEEADLLRINLAQILHDQQQITVLKEGQDAVDDENADLTPYLININTASSETLKTLPGIGDVIAQDIISYRETKGGFKSVDELANVDRIGSKTLEKIRGMITV